MSLSPHPAPALSDDDGAPVRETSHQGSHSGGGGGFLEAPGGVITIDWSGIFRRFYEKFRG